MQVVNLDSATSFLVAERLTVAVTQPREDPHNFVLGVAIHDFIAYLEDHPTLADAARTALEAVLSQFLGHKDADLTALYSGLDVQTAAEVAKRVEEPYEGLCRH